MLIKAIDDILVKYTLSTRAIFHINMHVPYHEHALVPYVSYTGFLVCVELTSNSHCFRRTLMMDIALPGEISCSACTTFTRLCTDSFQVLVLPVCYPQHIRDLAVLMTSNDKSIVNQTDVHEDTIGSGIPCLTFSYMYDCDCRDHWIAARADATPTSLEHAWK